MSKTASTAKTFGVTMEESVGHITAISSVTQESGKIIGNALKTIYSRITTMEDAETILKSVGVSIKEIGENGEEYVRPVQDILSDLAVKWDGLSDAQRQQIAVTLAGRYQLSRFLAMMNNWDIAVEATTTALTSQGSAMRENGKYLESFEARINQLKVGFTELALSVGDAILSDGMMTLIELGKSLAQVVTDLIDKIGALPALFLAISGLMGKFGYLNKIHSWFVGLIDKVISLGKESRRTAQEMQTAQRTMQATETATKGVEAAMDGATTATKTLGASIKGVLASTLIGAAFVVAGWAIEKFIGKMAEAKREAEEFEKQQNKMVEAFHKVGSAKGLEDLINQYDKLADKANRTTEEEQEYQALRAQLVENFPTLVDYYDEEGNAVLKSTDAMKDQIPTLEKLSRAKANVTKAEFKEKIEKEVKSWNKLSENIEKTSKKIAELRKKPETSEVPMVTGYEVFAMPENSTIKTKDGKGVIEINNAKALAKEEQKLLQLQQERAHQLNVINKLISDQTLAYMEVDGVMSKLSDKQIKAIEDYSSSHTKSINKRLKELEKEGASQKEIADFLETKGKAIAQKGTEIAKAYSKAFEEIVKTTNGSQAEINKVKTAVDSVAMSLGEDWYKFKDADEISKSLNEIVKISYEMGTDGAGSVDSYIERVKGLGYETNEAIRIVGNLAKENKNAEIYQQALKQGFEETTPAIDDYNNSLLETIDLTSTLLGDGASEEMKALESNIALIMLYNEKLGESAGKHWEYNEALSNTSASLGISKEQLLENIEKIAFLTQVTSELNPVLNETADGVTAWNELSEEQDKKLQNLGITQDELLMKYIEHQNWQTAILDVLGLLNTKREEEASATENSKNKTAEDTQAKKENAEATAAQAQAVETLTEKFNTFKEKNDAVSRSAYIDTIKQQLGELDGQVTVTKDDTGKLKLVMSDGTESQWLNTLQSQLGELGLDLGLVKDESGKIKLVLNDATGSTTLATIETDAEDAKIAIGDTIKEHEILKEKAKSLPNDYSKINFFELFFGLSTTTQQIQLLSDALGGVWENVQFVMEKLGELSKKVESIKDAIKGLRDNNVGTFDDLIAKAGEAKASIGRVSKAISEMNDKAKEIPMGAFNNFNIDAENAKKYVENLKASFNDLSNKINGVTGSSSLYSIAVNTINASTATAVGVMQLYVEKLSTLSKVLVSVAEFNKSLATSQGSVSEAMKSVINSINSYGTSMVHSTNAISQGYINMAIIVAKNTAKIISEYRSHGGAVLELVSITSNAWGNIVQTTVDRGGTLVSAIEEVAGRMHKAFKDGVDSIVNVAKGLPARIGKGVRDHMNEASSSMDAVAKDMVRRFKKELGIHSPSRVFEELGGWVIKGLANGLTGEDLKSLGKEVFSDFGGGVFDSWEMIKAYVSNDWSNLAGSGVERWRGVAAKALAMTGQLTPANLERLLFQMKTESGGNPKAINLWDINAKRGTPSKGLMQVIDPTFQAYKMPGYNNIWNPLDNILASIRYTLARYGSLLRGWRGVGYEEGGFIEKEHLAMVGEGDKREVVIPLEQHKTRAVDLWRQAGEELGLLRKLRSYGGFGASISGGFGALSGEGGSAEGGGGSGTSGIIQPSIYVGSTNLDGVYDFFAFESVGEKRELDELYRPNYNERSITITTGNLRKLERIMERIRKNTSEYRDALKEVVNYNGKLLKLNRDELSITEKRNEEIENRLKNLSNVTKHTEEQRKEYNELQKEYEQNLSRISSLKSEIESLINTVKKKSEEVFSDLIDGIINTFNESISGIEYRIDNINFKIDVIDLIDGDSSEKVSLLADKVRELNFSIIEYEATRKTLERELWTATQKYGHYSDVAINIRKQLQEIEESYEDAQLNILRTEKEIANIRGKTADEIIEKLKGYYKQEEEMALKAKDKAFDNYMVQKYYETVKRLSADASKYQVKNAEDAHKAIMDIYNEEISKINELYDERINQIDRKVDEENYQKQLDEMINQRADLENRIAVLSLDNSLEGRKRLSEAQSELEDLQKKIDDFMEQRHINLLKEQLKEQQKAQVREIELDRDKYEEMYNNRVKYLDEEKREISEHYNSIIEDEKRWSKMREDLMKGNFKVLSSELAYMGINLEQMNNGIFDTLSNNFEEYSQSVREFVNEINSMVRQINDITSINPSTGNINYDGTVNLGRATRTNELSFIIEKALRGIDMYEPTPEKVYLYNLIREYAPTVGDNLEWQEYIFDEILRKAIDNMPLDIPTPEKMVIYNLFQEIMRRNGSFDTGGYTGRWSGNEGRLAILHQKELVLNNKQTKHILDTAKIIDRVKDVIPNIKIGSISRGLLEGINNISNNYELNVNIEKIEGNKEGANTVVKEIMKGLRKMKG